MRLGTPKVRIDEEDPAFQRRQGQRQVDGRQRLALTGSGGRDDDDARSRVGPGIVQRRTNDAVRLGERVLGVPPLNQQIRRGLTRLGNDTEQGSSEMDTDVVRCLERVVEVLEEEGESDGQEDAEERTGDDVALAIGANRAVGKHRRIDDADVRDVELLRDVGLLVP